MRLIMWLMITILSVGFSTNVLASNLCQGKFPNPITDVCWSCMFPISIGKAEVFAGDKTKSDTQNPTLPLCSCPMPGGVRVGVTMGFWEPLALVDVTRHQYCMVNLGGLQLNKGKFGADGEVETDDPSQGGSFYHVHWYKFPLLYWLNLLTDSACVENGNMDIAMMTELDPTWHDDELTYLLNPEAILFGNLVSQAACSVDSVATMAEHPVDTLFWCAGAQGSMYPMNGFVQDHIGGVQASTLLTERMTYKLHREQMVWDSVGENSPTICTLYPSPILPKSRYRYQMVNPIPTASEGEDGCHAFGHTTTLWGAMHEFPVKGEDFGYLVWRKRNCCAG